MSNKWPETVDAYIRITKCVCAADECIRRENDLRDAWKRMMDAFHNLTDSDRAIYERICAELIPEVVKNATSSLD